MKKGLLKAAAVVAFAVGVTGCSDAPKATKALDDAGYTNIQIEGAGFYGCGEDDDFTTKFKAINPNGKTVEGVVCSSWGPFAKGSTIRTR
jgi:hypothetical protein